MLHACLVSTLLCFVYTLRHFYTFSGTNLLTRCHSVSCLFSAVFGFRKASKKIFSELDGTKAEVPIFPTQYGVQSRDGGEPRGGQTTLGMGPPLAAPRHGVGPSGSHLPCPFTYIIPSRQKP